MLSTGIGTGNRRYARSASIGTLRYPNSGQNGPLTKVPHPRRLVPLGGLKTRNLANIDMKSKKVNIKRPLYFEISETIFNRRVHVLLNATQKEWKAFTKKVGVTTDSSGVFEDAANFEAFSTQIDSSDRPTQWVIVLKNFDWTIKDQGSLIHEIVHTIVKIWKSNNIPFTPDNQEFLAHSIGNLYEDIVRKILTFK